MKRLRAKSIRDVAKIAMDPKKPLRMRHDAIAVIGLRQTKSVVWDLFELRWTVPELRHILDLTYHAAGFGFKESQAWHEKEKDRLQALLVETGARTERHLIRIVDDARASEELRDRCCTALGDIRSLKAIPSLLRILASDSHKAGSAAVHALNRIGSRRATLGLMSILRNASSLHSRWDALDWFWEFPAIDETLKRRALARLRECCADSEGIPGYDENNGQRARQILKNYARFGPKSDSRT